MKALIFTIVIAVFATIFINEFRDPPEHMMTEAEKIERLVDDFTFNTPQEIVVLSQNEVIDNKTRERVLTIVLQTDSEYLPKTPRIADRPAVVLKALQTTVPDHDFGEALEKGASYFHWLSTNSKWSVASMETTTGHYSRWEKRVDVYEATLE
jgi:hypothetical protein